MKSRPLFALALLAWAGVAPAMESDAKTRAYARALDSEEARAHLEAPARKDLGYSRLGPDLAQLAVSGKGGFGGGLEEAAKSLNIPLEDDLVAVQLWPEDGMRADDLSDKVRRLGGRVETALDGSLLARAPAAALEDLERMKGLDYAAGQTRFELTAVNAGALGEGVRAAAVEPLHRAGLTGKGVKIGVLDSGFERYRDLQARGVAPKPAAFRSFPASHDAEKAGLHGAACAEIVHAMAPDAQLYLAHVDLANDSIINAARWLADQGVDIITMSLGGHGGALNGQSDVDRVVDELTERGILFTIAAGNAGQEHWLGRTRDANGNKLIDVPDNPDGDFLVIKHGGGPYMLIANWDDWGAAGQPPSARNDIDLILFRPLGGGKLEAVAVSDNPQRGRGKPLEGLAGNLPRGEYLLALKASEVRDDLRLHILARGTRLLPTKAEGSVASPGVARAAVTVGAIHVDDRKLAAYSSQGPTDDGRVKPDLSAPSNVASAAYGNRFPGTSSATPHVAGFAALVKQAMPELSGASLREAVIGFVREVERPAPNNRVGRGHIDGARLLAQREEVPPPSASPRPPASGKPPAGDDDAAVRARLRPLAPLFDLIGK